MMKNAFYFTSEALFVLNFELSRLLKQKSVRGNHATFMTKELNKAIMNKSKAKTSCVKWPSQENFVAYKRAKNRCNSFTGKAKRKFSTKGRVISNRTFWKTVKPWQIRAAWHMTALVRKEMENRTYSEHDDVTVDGNMSHRYAMLFQRLYGFVRCHTASYRRWNDVMCLQG